MADKKKKFHTRGFISLVSFWTFILLAGSGIFLYITPSGRIANWSNWTMLNLTKEGWAGLHTIISLLFLLMIMIHIYLNWKPLLNYLKNKAKSSFSLKKELVLSLVVTAIFLIGAVKQSQPVWQLMNWSEDIKGYWETTYTNPPVPHAEDMTLAEISEISKIGKESLIKTLKMNNITIPSDQAVLKDIAAHNNLKPNELYALFENEKNTLLKNTGDHPGMGGGYGRITFEQYIQSKNIDFDFAESLLKKQNIKVTRDETIKEIADKHDLMPFEIVKFLEGGGN
jgi:hypothetical protein